MELRFENLMKQYEGKTVLDLDKCRVSSGSRTAIVGPNGAGKSTLVNMIAGLTKPSSGKIFYGGSEQIPAEKVTLVFQKPYLLSTTVEKNISYPLKLRRWKEADILERVESLMSELNLSDLKKRKAWKLSGGEVQKVALARALSFHPQLLLLDEPTANIDPSTTSEIEKMLLKINEKEQVTIVMITHNLAQAKRVCNRCLFFNQGNLLEEGDTADLLQKPTTKEAEIFIRGELLI